MKLLVLPVLLTGICGSSSATPSPAPLELKPLRSCSPSGAQNSVKVSFVKDSDSNHFTVTFVNDSPATATITPKHGMFVSGYDFRDTLVVGRIEHTAAGDCGWGTKSKNPSPRMTTEERCGFIVREIQGEVVGEELHIASKSSAALVITPVVNTVGMINEGGTVEVQVCCDVNIADPQRGNSLMEFRYLSDRSPFTMDELMTEKQVPAKQPLIRTTSSGW